MKKFNLLVFVLFLLSGCGEDSAKIIRSGSLSDSVNSEASVTLNFRINQEAINAHSSLLFYEQLSKLSDDSVSSSSGLAFINELRSLFAYLHKIDNPLKIESLKVMPQNGGHLLIFSGATDTYEVWSNQQVSRVLFKNNSSVCDLVQLSKDLWKIQNNGETFIWNVKDQNLCSSNECINL